MPRRDAGGAACDLRAALADAGSAELREGYTPDEAAAEFAARFAGPPAHGRRSDEPALIYPQDGRPALCFGAYGGEARVRGWLAGLPARIAPDSLAKLVPIKPSQRRETDHIVLPTVSLAHLPVPQVTPRDAGRYITMGFVMADGGGDGFALSAHRMLVLDDDRLGVWMLPSRKLRALTVAAHAEGRGLPVSVNIGAPPAVAIASATSAAWLPDQWSKLAIAGALADAPIEISNGLMDGVAYLSRAEIILEGEILPETVPEITPGRSPGRSMPEFLGYDGCAQKELAVLHVRTVRARPSALFQAVVGPGREQSVILGLGGALTLALALGDEGRPIHNLRFSHSGGGMLLLFVALRRDHDADIPALARRLVGLSPFIKTIVFVDDDVDIGNEEDVLWAMTTRAQLAGDCHAIPDQAASPMDPSQSPGWIEAKSTKAFKSFVDATAPRGLRALVRRSFDAIDDTRRLR